MKRNLVVLAVVFLLDQLTKKLAMSGKILFDSPILSFTFVKNTGSSFSLLQGFNTYLLWLSVIVLGGIIYYYNDSENKLALTLIGAGVLGNLTDRVLLGYVVDFINLHWWPVFNVADSSIVVGVLFIIFWDVRKGRS